MSVACPTCVRMGQVCYYCATLCVEVTPAGVPPYRNCSCACHAADVEREAEIQAEQVARIKL